MEKIDKQSSHVLIRIRELEDENKMLKRKVNELSAIPSQDSYKDTAISEPALRKLLEDQEKIMYMAVHDLKNPLSNIKAINGIFKKDLEKPKEKQLTESNKVAFLNIMETVCDQTFAIIQDLLFVGELKLKKIELSETDIVDLLQKNLVKNSFIANEKNIIIDTYLPKEAVYASINKEKFNRAVDNILSNAVKFTKVNGNISVELIQKSDTVLLKISDSGIGIPPHFQAIIFDQFTDANRKGTLDEVGTGMGLYIVKRIMEMHGGKVWYESIVDKGTSFFIEINKI